MVDQAVGVASLLPFAGRVRRVASDEPFRWLAAGWRDFRLSRGLSAAYAFGFVVAGFCLTVALAAAGATHLVLPLASGFLLVGPAVTVGFYAISRSIEAGSPPSMAVASRAWRANPRPLIAMGLAMLAFLALWLLLAGLVFALSFPDAGFDWQRALVGTLPSAGGLTARGLGFLGFGTAVGAAMAAVAFVAGAFSLPLMLDRRVGLAEAVATSAVAVVLNVRAMAVWAGLVVLFTAAGLACWYVGLVVTLPLIGHATWHAYRAVIRFPP